MAEGSSCRVIGMLVLFRLRLPFQDSRPVVYRRLHVPLHGLFSMPGKEVPTGRDEVGTERKTTAEMEAEVAEPADFCRKHHFLRNIPTDKQQYHRGAIRRTPSLQSRRCKYRNPNADHRHSDGRNGTSTSATKPLQPYRMTKRRNPTWQNI